MFNQFGDLERCDLRPGNVHSADGWDDVLKPVILRYRGRVWSIYFRADAAFAMPGVYEYLEAEHIKYAIRLPANQVLQNRIGYCSNDRSDGPQTKSADTTRTSPTRRPTGASRAG